VYVSIHTYFIVIIEQGFICCWENKMNDFLYPSSMDGMSVELGLILGGADQCSRGLSCEYLAHLFLESCGEREALHHHTSRALSSNRRAHVRRYAAG
jgi:hypothetical protein